jgi:hypothetical protein
LAPFPSSFCLLQRNFMKPISGYQNSLGLESGCSRVPGRDYWRRRSFGRKPSKDAGAIGAGCRMKTMTPVPRPKTYDGPPILSYGFRPFFLSGAIYSAAAIAIWLPRYFGELTFVTLLSPLAWHTHEMLFGFVVAVITGFLLTAIPNWTGRLPLQGGPLLILLIIWLTGRMAIVFAAVIGWLPAMAMDCAFLAAVTVAVAR